MTEERETDWSGKGKAGIRAWYEKSTRKARIALVFATAVMAIGMFAFWFLVPHEWAVRLQTANGGYTIPAFGGLWIAAFMFIWLIPMRELSFRGQESMERMEAKISSAIDDDLRPAIEQWRKLGEKVETEVLPEIRAAVQEMKTGFAEIRASVKNASGVIVRAEAKVERMESTAIPALERLSRVADRVDKEVDPKLIADVRQAAAAARDVSVPRGEAPSVGRALDVIRRKAALGNGAQERRLDI